MKDILLIRGGDSRDIIDALWVADEIADAMGEDVQIDIAVPEAYAAYARLSTSVRRVIALPAVEHFSAGADDEAGDSGGGAGDAASVATGAAKKLFSFAKNVAASAGGNLRAYKAVAGDLRLVKYDTVFDFDSSGASLAVARLLKVKEIVGFDEKNIKSPLPGATMMYHATHHISGDTSNSMRLRQLAARYFSYEAKKRDCKIPRTETTTPAQPYVIIDGSVPDAFLQVLRDGGFNLVNVDSEADDALPAVEIVELARHATAVVGNGAATAIIFDTRRTNAVHRRQMRHARKSALHHNPGNSCRSHGGSGDETAAECGTGGLALVLLAGRVPLVTPVVDGNDGCG